MKDFRQLRVWEKSHNLVLETYKILDSLPDREKYALSQQIQRSVTSIPTNIAEGCGRGTDADFSKFLYYSIGSCSEFEYQMLLAKDLEYISIDSYNLFRNKVSEVRKMLIALMKTIKTDS